MICHVVHFPKDLALPAVNIPVHDLLPAQMQNILRGLGATVPLNLGPPALQDLLPCLWYHLSHQDQALPIKIIIIYRLGDLFP